MPPRKPRHLRPEEEALWKKVAEQIHRLKPEPPKAAPPPKPPEPAQPEKPAKPKPAPKPFRVGQRATPKGEAPIGASPPLMDKKAYGRLQKGKLTPERKIDLHGMTLDEAHPALVDFILRSHAKGLRLVLVITGKGKGRETIGGVGILRRQVPMWLHQAPLGPLILEISEAHSKHGGGGALYVYLRRRR